MGHGRLLSDFLPGIRHCNATSSSRPQPDLVIKLVCLLDLRHVRFQSPSRAGRCFFVTQTQPVITRVKSTEVRQGDIFKATGSLFHRL